MANIEIDFVSDHGKTDVQPDEATGETIPLTPAEVIEGGSTWEPEQEASFRGTSMGMEVLKEYVKAFYHMLPNTWTKAWMHSKKNGSGKS